MTDSPDPSERLLPYRFITPTMIEPEDVDGGLLYGPCV